MKILNAAVPYYLTDSPPVSSCLQQPDAEVTPELWQRDTGAMGGESAPGEMVSPLPRLAIWIRGTTNTITRPDKPPQSNSANYRGSVRQHRMGITKSYYHFIFHICIFHSFL